MNYNENIVLLGMMGSGKSTIGKLLDKKLGGFAFVDIDYEIEKKNKKTIKQIFAESGEPAFRSLEEETIKHFAIYKKLVISTGGGAVERFENIKRLQKNGILFYLSANPKTLLERIENTSDRPLLDTKNPLKVIEERLEKRKIYYKMADFEINTEKKELLNIVNEILEKYELYERNTTKSQTES